MKPCSRRYCSVFVVSFFYTFLLFAQPDNLSDKAYNYVLQSYGSDQKIVNGKFFIDKYLNDIGHPFYPEKTFQNGEFTLHGNDYKRYKILYNVFEQTIVIQYDDENGKLISFQPPMEFISKFKINNLTFTRNDFLKLAPEYISEIFKSSNFAFYFSLTKKKYESHHNISSLAYKYSNQIPSYFIVYKEESYKISNKKSFVNLFDKSIGKQVSRYMRKNDIKFPKSDLGEILVLLDFVNGLIENN
ncbi:MAG: hypothetical protein JXA77_05290 [Bacteroidales bacterium]|nr:hypothetical protein [Bacteroidales bacterium]MBN2818936.1 hypothetical protein [Bacteroidales bacterium]